LKEVGRENPEVHAPLGLLGANHLRFRNDVIVSGGEAVARDLTSVGSVDVVGRIVKLAAARLTLLTAVTIPVFVRSLTRLAPGSG